MILYGHPLSGNTHKVRLLLSALKVEHDERVVDVTAGAQRKPEFLALNPRGQVPVLVDGDATIYDAQAILVYLARRYDETGTFLPLDAEKLATIVGWLSFAANEIQNGPQAARVHFLLGVPMQIEQVQGMARSTLRLLDARLEKHPFLELDRLTIADLACFPCAALAPGGKVSLDDYPHVQAWIRRIRALPFFVPMPGIEAA